MFLVSEEVHYLRTQLPGGDGRLADYSLFRVGHGGSSRATQPVQRVLWCCYHRCPCIVVAIFSSSQPRVQSVCALSEFVCCCSSIPARPPALAAPRLTISVREDGRYSGGWWWRRCRFYLILAV